MEIARKTGGFKVLLSAFSIIQVASAEPNAYKVPAITELSYDKARLILIQSGWQPASTVRDNDVLFGQAKELQDAGFREVNDCAGTGAAPCVMYFRDPKGNFLMVHTLGEAYIKKKIFPMVDYYQLVDRLPTVDESKNTPTKISPIPVAAESSSSRNESKSIAESSMDEAKKIPPDAECTDMGNTARYIAEQRDNKVPANIVLSKIGQKYKKTISILYQHPEESPANAETGASQACMAVKISLRKLR